MTGRVLVTGASGFIGRDLVGRLAASGWHVGAALRDPGLMAPGERIEPVAIGDLATLPTWSQLLDGVSHIVHLAGIAHASDEIPEATYMAVNAGAVEAMARAARASGVTRIVLVSSVRAQCGPFASRVLTESAPASPSDAYGRSKLAGERVLAEALAGSGTDWCVLRPVVLYGRGVKANMRALARLSRSRLPLPLGSLPARRSVLGLVNMSAAVQHALTSKSVAGGTYLVADPGPLTIPQMIAAMRRGLGRGPGVLGVPLAPLRLAAAVLGRRDAWERIAGDLVVSTAAFEATGWQPTETAAEGLARWMAEEAGLAPPSERRPS